MNGRRKRSEFFIAGSLEKVFPDRRPEAWKPENRLCILKGETPAVQLVYYRRPGGAYPALPRVSVQGDGISGAGPDPGGGACAFRFSLL